MRLLCGLFASLVVAACGGTSTTTTNPIGGGTGTTDVSSALTAMLGQTTVGGVGLMLQPQNESVLIHFTDAGFASGAYAIARLSSSGHLDLGFGDGGAIRFTNDKIQGNYYDPDQVPRIALGSGGEIYIAHSVANSGGTDIVIQRYTPNGALDMSFGESGQAAIDFPTRGAATGIRSLSDGSVVVAARVNPSGNGVWTLALAHLLSTGAPDPAFGQAGQATYPQDPHDISQLKFIDIDPDGSILIAGAATIGMTGQNDPRILLTRYTANGQFDASFGTNGQRFLDNTLWSSFLAVAHRNDGFFVLGGAGGCFTQINLASFKSDGSADVSFGMGGQVTLPYGRCSIDQFSPTKLVIAPDGKIVMSDVVAEGFAYLRLNVDGTVDQSFGIDGFRVSGPPHHSMQNQGEEGLVVNAEGKLITLGSAAAQDGFPCTMMASGWCGPLPQLMVTRLLPTGAPDTSFPN
jgi:uncharacterized delta-60 repeat protein